MLRRMRYLQLLWSRLLQRGRISPAAYRVLTGLVMLYVGRGLVNVRGDDPVAGPVGVVFLVLGVVLTVRGALAIRDERRARSS